MLNQKFISSACCSFVVAIALAPASALAFNDDVVNVSIKAQPLETALNTLARSYDKQIVVYSADAKGLNVKALLGSFTEKEALNKILSGTGLEYRYMNNRTIAVGSQERLGGLNENQKTLIGDQPEDAQNDHYTAPKETFFPYEDEISIDEIIVTAQKREQNLGDVPISMSVVMAGEFEQQAITRVVDILELTPNLEVVETSAGATIVMRGVSRGRVAQLFNGVGVGTAATSGAPAFDIDRVEILRGPQGSIYGRNAAGGVINYVARKPVNDTELKGRVDVANHNYRKFSGLVNLPIVSEKATVRINTFYEDGGGWIKNAFDGRALESSEKYGFRGQLKLDPSDTFSTNVLVQYNNSKPDDHAAYYIEGSTTLDFWVDTVNTNLGKSVPAVQTDIFAGVADIDGAVAGSADVWSLQAHLDLDLGWVSLQSVTSYRDHSSRIVNEDGDATSLDLLKRDIDANGHAFTQEFRLVSVGDKKMDYVLGLYYERDVDRGRIDTSFGEDGSYILSALLSQEIAEDINASLGLPVLPTDFTPLFDTSAFDTVYDMDTNSSVALTYSAFGNLTYKLTEKLHLTAGGRLNHINRSQTRLGIPTEFNLSEFALPDLESLIPLAREIRSDFSGFTVPSAILEEGPVPDVKDTDWGAAIKATYFAHDDLMFYASITRGFTPGFVSVIRISDTENDVSVLPPEVVWSYEAGSKASFFDGRLLVNSSIYYLNYSNFRTSTINGTSFEVSNAGGMRNYGFEFEVMARPISELTIRAAIGHTNAQYKDNDGEDRFGCFLGQTVEQGCIEEIDPETGDPSGTFSQLRSGRQVERSAKWNGNVGFTYRDDLASNWSWFVSGDVTFRSRIFRSNDFDPRSITEPYQRFNARLGFDNESYSIIVWGRNLTNERYAVGGARSQLTGITDGAYLVAVNQPRTYGVTLTAKF